MTRRTYKTIKEIVVILLMLAFVAVMIVCFFKFIGAEDIYDKVEYGFWVVILLTLTLRE